MTKKELTITLLAAKSLRNFNPAQKYAGYEGMYHVGSNICQEELSKMGRLVEKMTRMGAPENEFMLVLKHSMVLLDAPKHNLDYKKSAEDHSIDYILKKYKHVGDFEYINRKKVPV